MNKRRTLLTIVSGVMAGSVLLAGCGSAASSAQGNTTKSPTTTAKSSTGSLLSEIPSSLRPAYAHSGLQLQPSVYSHLKPAKRPWQLCFSDHLTSNPFHAAIINDLKLMNQEFAKAGYTTPNLIITNSNNNVATQVTQMQSLVNRGCSGIMAIFGSPNGFNGVLKSAYDKNIPVVSGATVPSSPYSENVLNNFYWMGSTWAQGIASAIQGKGNVVMVEGVAGGYDTTAEKAGAMAVFNKYPGIKIVADVYGNWVPSQAKSVMLQVLATHPQPIAAVWATGESMEAIGQAFEQAHRPLPKVITGTGTGFSLGWWHKHMSQVQGVDVAQEPDMLAQQMFRVEVRLLMGQHPKVNDLIEALPVITNSNLDHWWQSCMTPSNTAAFPESPTDPWPTSLLNKLFVNGQNVPVYNYTNSTIPACSS